MVLMKRQLVIAVMKSGTPRMCRVHAQMQLVTSRPIMKRRIHHMWHQIYLQHAKPAILRAFGNPVHSFMMWRQQDSLLMAHT